MKRILFILFTFLSINLFAQTEPANRFRTSTGILESVLGTNFKKDTVIVGGKKTLVYRQPNTDTYHTVSAVNDSLRFQKWKFDTISQVFVSSNLDDVFIDNVVNKATNFINITSTSDTSIYSTVAQEYCPSSTIAKLDSCNVSYLFVFNCSNNSWVTLKIGKSISVDTNTISTVPTRIGNTDNLGKIVQSDTTVLLQEINAQRLIDNCGNALELSEYKNTEFFVTRKYAKEPDNNGLASLSNPAFARQLKNARMGDDHAPFPYPDDVWTFAKAKGLTQLTVNMSDDTFKISNSTTPSFSDGKINLYPSYGSFFDNIGTTNIKKININQPNGTMMFTGWSGLFLDWNGGSNASYEVNMNLDKLIFTGNTSGITSIGSSSLHKTYSYPINININTIEGLGSSWFSIDYKNSNANINIKNIKFGATKQTVGINYTKNKIQQQSDINIGNFSSRNDSITTLDHSIIISNLDSATNKSINFNIDNVNFKHGSTTRLSYHNIFESSDSIIINEKWGNLEVKGDNSFTLISEIDLANYSYSHDITLKNSLINYCYNNIKIDSGIVSIMGTDNASYHADTFKNCKILYNIKQANLGTGQISVWNGITLINSTITFNCEDCTTTNKGFYINNVETDPTSAIIIKGNYKQKHSTNSLVEIGTNNLATPRIILDGTFITGGGNSVSSTNPINIIVKPGCSSNVSTSSNVTQLGSGIYVDPNFNN